MQRLVVTGEDSGMEEEKEAVTRTRNAVGLDKAFSYRSREKRQHIRAVLEETVSSGDRGRNSHRAGWQSSWTGGAALLDAPQTHHKARSAPKTTYCSKGHSKFSLFTP